MQKKGRKEQVGFFFKDLFFFFLRLNSPSQKPATVETLQDISHRGIPVTQLVLQPQKLSVGGPEPLGQDFVGNFWFT